MKCEVEDCNLPITSNKLCSMHYQRFHRHGSTDSLRPRVGNHKCLDDNCNTQAKYSSGLCEKHHKRMAKYGRVHKIVDRGCGYSIDHRGYVSVFVNGKIKLEHILLAEQALGKPLPKGAEVHHMNKKPWDNHTPFNLIVCPNKEYHLLLHKRAKELGYEGY